jgi:hypothetical protein
MADMKKDLQKAIKAFLNAQEKQSEYPKAMMTAQQMRKGTATINCGYDEIGKARAPHVIAFQPFIDWCVAYGIKTVEVESVSGSYSLNCGAQYQIRVTY